MEFNNGIFSKECKIQGEFIIKRKKTSISHYVEYEDTSEEENVIAEANRVEIKVPENHREAKLLPEAKHWHEAMDKKDTDYVRETNLDSSSKNTQY